MSGALWHITLGCSDSFSSHHQPFVAPVMKTTDMLVLIKYLYLGGVAEEQSDFYNSGHVDKLGF